MYYSTYPSVTSVPYVQRKTIISTAWQIFLGVVIAVLLTVAVVVPVVVTNTNTMFTVVSSDTTTTAEFTTTTVTTITTETTSTTITTTSTETTSTIVTTTTTRTSTTTETTTTTVTTTTTTTSSPYPCGNMTTFIGFDLSATNIGLKVNIPWATCCATCLANATCGSFTWVISAQNCYWKIKTTSNGTVSSNCISAKFF